MKRRELLKLAGATAAVAALGAAAQASSPMEGEWVNQNGIRLSLFGNQMTLTGPDGSSRKFGVTWGLDEFEFSIVGTNGYTRTYLYSAGPPESIAGNGGRVFVRG